MPFSHTAPSALLLDLDGTLADSLAVMRHVYDQFLLGFGKAPTTGEFQALNGPPLPVVVATLKASHSLTPDLDGLITLYQRRIDEAYDRVAPMAGAGELMKTARRYGWGIAVVTSNAEARTRRWLDRTGLALFTDAVVAAERAGRGKPFPDPYLQALRDLNQPAASAVAVEDSPLGARAAAAAGVRVIVCGATGAETGWPDGALFRADLPAVRDGLFHDG